MKPLPLPLRIAAGLVATAFEQAKDLPRQLVELPVTAVSQTLQVSMRVQQKVTELAIKGDRALSLLVPVQEKPSWATFDDDVDERPSRNGAGLRSAPHRTYASTGRPEPVAAPVASSTKPGAGPSDSTAASITPDAADGEPRLDAVEDAEALQLVEDAVDDEGGAPAEEPAESGPAVLPAYPAMTIPQLRGHLRFLTLPQLHELLAWEEAHGNRPPFVTMLGNRITTVAG